MEFIRPAGWDRAKGYAHAVAASGKMLFVSGQVGWDREHQFHARDMAGQAKQALENLIAIIAAAGARPEHVTRLTWYVTDKAEYARASRAIGEAYRALMGMHYPSMSVVEVKGLVEDEALVEIEATAVLPQ
jgi:enamine deaminase RidA (YjgF/YER057c/UK114 family)